MYRFYIFQSFARTFFSGPYFQLFSWNCPIQFHLEAFSFFFSSINLANITSKCSWTSDFSNLKGSLSIEVIFFAAAPWSNYQEKLNKVSFVSLGQGSPYRLDHQVHLMLKYRSSRTGPIGSGIPGWGTRSPGSGHGGGVTLALESFSRWGPNFTETQSVQSSYYHFRSHWVSSIQFFDDELGNLPSILFKANDKNDILSTITAVSTLEW